MTNDAKPEHRLAAIMATDVVGYSQSMQSDEAGTLSALSAIREATEDQITQHRGRIANTAGDSVLAEFTSAVEAVSCAIALQEELSRCSQRQCLQLRVGIHIGDVVDKGGDLFGTAVNVAARLEGIAQPGGIVVSAAVRDAIAGKLPASFTDLGLKALKNIAEPVRTYALSPIPEAKSIAVDALSRHIDEMNGLPHWVRAAAALTAIAIVIGAWVFLTQLNTASALVPSIAVLPFTNMSGDPKLSYFSDGVSEGIISMLARSPDLSVVARNSSFTYKGKPYDVRQIGKDLGVGYVLEGYVRKETDEVGIVARLIDAKTGEFVWPARFEKAGTDPLVLQDQLTSKILSSLAGEKGKRGQAMYRVAWGKDTANLEEYDYYLRGDDFFMKFEKDANEKAGEVLREGLAKLPNSTLLQLKLGWYHWERAFNGWSDTSSEDYKKAGELARKAFTYPNLTPLELRSLCCLLR